MNTVSIDLAFQAFLLDCEARRLTPKTLSFYQQRLIPFFDYLTVESIHEITAVHIRAYIVELQRRNLSDSTQHAFARSIRAFLNFCIREEWLEKTPMDKVKMPKRDKKILPALDPSDANELLKHAHTERDKAVLLCLLDTGCRAAEFCNLNGGDVDIKTGAVRIIGGKGGKDRVTFLGSRSRKQLLRYYAERGMPGIDEPVWISYNGGNRLTLSGLQQLLYRIGEQAGIKNCGPHTFRRTFALWSLRSGMNIFALQQLMGHSDLSTLKKYLALVERDLQDAHRNYGAVDKML
jgi:site-specific recombinase XerD